MRTSLKRFERQAEKSRDLSAGMLKLAFFDVDLKNSELIFELDSFDEKSFDLADISLQAVVHLMKNHLMTILL